jgi:hypothetical protein
MSSVHSSQSQGLKRQKLEKIDSGEVTSENNTVSEDNGTLMKENGNLKKIRLICKCRLPQCFKVMFF